MSYLDHLTISKIRISLSQLRVASHRLSIETGRWHKPQQIHLKDRKCIVCNVLEDEYHFILECCLNEGLRKKFCPYFAISDREWLNLLNNLITKTVY